MLSKAQPCPFHVYILVSRICESVTIHAVKKHYLGIIKLRVLRGKDHCGLSVITILHRLGRQSGDVRIEAGLRIMWSGDLGSIYKL